MTSLIQATLSNILVAAVCCCTVYFGVSKNKNSVFSLRMLSIREQ